MVNAGRWTDHISTLSWIDGCVEFGTRRMAGFTSTQLQEFWKHATFEHKVVVDEGDIALQHVDVRKLLRFQPN